MRDAIVRRLMVFFPTLLGATIVIFLILRVMPGDVALAVVTLAQEEGGFVDPKEVERIRERMGLNRPLVVQYGAWLWGLVTLDPGESVTMMKGRPVMELVGERWPVTVQLGLLTFVLAVPLAIALGVIAALRQDTWVDHIVRSVSITGLAMPNFWVGSLIILFLSIYFGWVPPIFYWHAWERPFQHITLMIWPALVLGWGLSSEIVRMTRSTVLEVMRQDYMRTAQAKGLSEWTRITRHALRNAMIPVVTMAGLSLITLMDGSVVMETIFGLPGIGSLVVYAVQLRDFAVVQFVVALFVVMVVTINLLVDLLYIVLDPRIRHV